MNRKIFILFILTIGIQFCHAQSIIYLDQDSKLISLNEFKKKCKQHIYKCLKYKSDSLIVNKIHAKYAFGNMPIESYEKIRLTLIKDSDINIPKDKTIVINYVDTIANYNSYLKHYEAYHKKEFANDSSYINSLSTTIKVNNKAIRPPYRREPISYKKHTKRAHAYMDRVAKCTKKLEKKTNVSISHIYNVNLPKNYSIDQVNWIKDSGFFKDNYFEMIYRTRFMVIKPNGEYFLSGTMLSYETMKKFLKSKDWSSYKKELELSHHESNINGFGTFKKKHYYNTLFCF